MWWWLLELALLLSDRTAMAELPELPDCPDDCDCHYFRINWVTDCSESNLTEVPSPEEGLSLNVYILNMNGNQLKEVNPFPADVKVRRLELADNKLTRITQEQFAGLKYLLDLDLSENKIKTVDPEAFRDSMGLITLEMQMNALEPIEGPFLISRSLLYLDLSDCQLSKPNDLFFQNVTALNKLDLSGNPLRTIEPGLFDPLISLEYLKLNRCNLTYISGQAFFHNEHIKMLELSENELKGPIDWIQVLGGLNRLENLNMRRSGISNLPEDVFANSTWLRNLVLSENELADLDVATTLGQNLRHLDSLDLSNCGLVGPLSDEAFANATKLRTLLLSGNFLTAADLAVALAPLERLERLSLRNCSLTRFPANTFHRLSSLQELDISRNPLNNAFTALLSPLESLERLDMGYSNLGRISKTTFSKMNSLKTLILSGNPLSSLESGLFQNLTRLETLELNHCGLTELNATVFPDNFTYPDLEELRLAGNPLKLSPDGLLIPRQLKRLRTLDLADCGLTSIPRGSFESFKNITRLLLAGNSLGAETNVSLEFLWDLPDLEVLDLSRNNLREITPNVFGSNRALNAIRLTENPWRCGCHIADMWEWVTVVKGDVGVLVGSTTAAEDSASGGGRKRKKSLLCHLDSRVVTTANKRPGRGRSRGLTENSNTTWARYVREAACDSSTSMRPARLLSGRTVRDVSAQLRKGDIITKEPNYWIITLLAVTGVVFVGSAILIFFSVYKKRCESNPVASTSTQRTTPIQTSAEKPGTSSSMRRVTK